MFMRLVSMKLKPGVSHEGRQFYEARVLPRLREMEGCLYAALNENVDRPAECISLTLWDSQAHAEAYQQSGTFGRLIQEAGPYLADAAEWKVQLSEDLTLEHKAVPEDPVVTSYSLQAGMTGESAGEILHDLNHLRIVRLQVQPGKLGEARDLYSDVILPVLRSVTGCRQAFLMGNVAADNELVSITIWETRADAENYERSGRYQQLLREVRHVLPGAYHWKMVLETKYGGQAFSSADVKVESYAVVARASFEQTALKD
jgi:quinol monooxygenase YgiN